MVFFIPLLFVNLTIQRFFKSYNFELWLRTIVPVTYYVYKTVYFKVFIKSDLDFKHWLKRIRRFSTDWRDTFHVHILTIDLLLISQLSGNEFAHLVSLNELHLGQNYLDFIPERMFQNLASLEKLYLFSNNIRQLNGESFFGLKNLSSLFLNNNVLRLIDDKLFEPLANLKKLYVLHDYTRYHNSPWKNLFQMIKITIFLENKNAQT